MTGTSICCPSSIGSSRIKLAAERPPLDVLLLRVNSSGCSSSERSSISGVESSWKGGGGSFGGASGLNVPKVVVEKVELPKASEGAGLGGAPGAEVGGGLDGADPPRVESPKVEELKVESMLPRGGTAGGARFGPSLVTGIAGGAPRPPAGGSAPEEGGGGPDEGGGGPDEGGGGPEEGGGGPEEGGGGPEEGGPPATGMGPRGGGAPEAFNELAFTTAV